MKDGFLPKFEISKRSKNYGGRSRRGNAKKFSGRGHEIRNSFEIEVQCRHLTKSVCGVATRDGFDLFQHMFGQKQADAARADVCGAGTGTTCTPSHHDISGILQRSFIINAVRTDEALRGVHCTRIKALTQFPGSLFLPHVPALCRRQAAWGPGLVCQGWRITCLH